MFEIQIEDHCSKLISSLQESFESSRETNCTLVCEGRTIKCHKYLLVAFSYHFKSLFSTEYPSETTIIIYVTNMKFEHLKVLIDSIYYGKLRISKDQFPELLKSAQSLGFTHLCNTESWNFTTTDSAEPLPSNGSKVDVCNKVCENTVEKSAVSQKLYSSNSQSQKENAVHEKSVQPSNDVEILAAVNMKTGQQCAPCMASTANKPLANVAPNQVPCKPALVPKAVGPQLFSEANSILSRCLELISKPVSNTTQTVPISTSANSNSVRSCAQMDQNYCQMPVQLNPSNSYVNYNIGKAAEAQYAARGYSDDTSFASKTERIRVAEQLSKMQTVHRFMGNKQIAMNYPKGYGKSEVTEVMSAPSWRYAQQYPQPVVGQRPRLFAPVSLTQSQKVEMNHHLRNFPGHPSSEAIRAAAALRQRQIPKSSSDYPQNFAQSFHPYDRIDPKLQYPKCLSNEAHQYPQVPTSKFDTPNSIRRNSMSHSIEPRAIYHSSSAEQESNLLSQALLVPPETRQTQSSATDKYISKDPFQALIAAKAAFKKKRDDEESSEKSCQLENHSNGSRPCSTNSCSSATNSVLGGRLEGQNPGEVSSKQQTNAETSSPIENNVNVSIACNESDDNTTHNKSEDPNAGSSDKLMQVVEECDLFIEEISEEEIEGDDGENNSKRDDPTPEVVSEQRLVAQPPIKKRKSNENENQVKSAKCEECGKVVSCIYYLQEHIRVKHKKQNLVCTELGCDFAVLDRSKFNNHLIEVHGKVRKRGRAKNDD